MDDVGVENVFSITTAKRATKVELPGPTVPAVEKQADVVDWWNGTAEIKVASLAPRASAAGRSMNYSRAVGATSSMTVRNRGLADWTFCN